MSKKVGRGGFKHIKTEEIVALYKNGATMKEISKKFNISHWTVLDRLEKANVRKTVRHTITDSVFSTFTEQSAYWGGFIAADGSVNKNGKSVCIELNAIDEDHLKKFCRFTGRDDKLWYRTRQRHPGGKISTMAAVSVISQQIVSDLKNNFNLIPNKTLILGPPSINLPKELRKHYIRGYIDGDGSIGWKKNNNLPRVMVCSGSKKIIEWIKTVIDEENIDTGTISILQNKGDKYFSIEYMGNYVYDLLDWLYSDSNTEIQLDRKYNRYLKYKTQRPPEKPDIDPEILKMFNLGTTYEEIANKLNIHRSTVINHLNKYNLNRANIPRATSENSILELFDSGFNIKDISKQLDIHKNTIHNYLIKNGRKNKRTKRSELVEQSVILFNSGLSTKEIAKHMSVSTRSVDRYLAGIKQK